MTFQEILNFIEIQDKRLEKQFGLEDREKRTLASIAKISEEQGELSGAVLSYLNLQRKDKKQNSKEDIANEVADVLITVMLLGHQTEVDIRKALENKIKKINARYE